MCHFSDCVKTYIHYGNLYISDIDFMPGLFTEATRVQLTAIQHLARIGYTYLGKISESDASSKTSAIPYDPETNILVDIFAKQFEKLDPTVTISAECVLSDIQKELDDDDLLEKFAKISLDIEKKKSKIIKENQKFTVLRDKLLPLLMNGQVVVG